MLSIRMYLSDTPIESGSAKPAKLEPNAQKAIVEKIAAALNNMAESQLDNPAVPKVAMSVVNLTTALGEIAVQLDRYLYIKGRLLGVAYGMNAKGEPVASRGVWTVSVGFPTTLVNNRSHANEVPQTMITPVIVELTSSSFAHDLEPDGQTWDGFPLPVIPHAKIEGRGYALTSIKVSMPFILDTDPLSTIDRTETSHAIAFSGDGMTIDRPGYIIAGLTRVNEDATIGVKVDNEHGDNLVGNNIADIVPHHKDAKTVVIYAVEPKETIWSMIYESSALSEPDIEWTYEHEHGPMPEALVTYSKALAADVMRIVRMHNLRTQEMLESNGGEKWVVNPYRFKKSTRELADKLTRQINDTRQSGLEQLFVVILRSIGKFVKKGLVPPSPTLQSVARQVLGKETVDGTEDMSRIIDYLKSLPTPKAIDIMMAIVNESKGGKP